MAEANTTLSSTRSWELLEKWRAWVFLGAGVLMLVGSIDLVLELLVGIETADFGVFAFFSVMVSYVGLLGLYPRLAERAPWLARVGVLLPLVPISILVVDVSALLVGANPPIGELIGGEAVFLSLFVGLGTGITAFAVASILTTVPSRAVGGALLPYAATWFVFLGVVVVYGSISDPITLLGNLAMAAGLLAVGYLLWDSARAGQHREPAADSPTR